MAVLEARGFHLLGAEDPACLHDVLVATEPPHLVRGAVVVVIHAAIERCPP